MVEQARLEKRVSVRRCRSVLRGREALAQGLEGCLGRTSCQRFEDCYQDLFVMERARRAVRAHGAKGGGGSGSTSDGASRMVSRSASPAEKGWEELASVCRDPYVLGRLDRMRGHPEASVLAGRLKTLCLRARANALATAEVELERMVETGSMSGIGELCRSLAARAGKKGARGPGGTVELPEKLAEKAGSLRKLCRDRWRMISVQRRINRIRRLEERGRCEKMLRICRSHSRFTRELYRTGQRAASDLAERFERVCEHDVPLAWLRKRLVEWRDKAGPLTCRRAKRIHGRLAERYPHGPMVHLASAWLFDVCDWKAGDKTEK
jgi:hypothetical protein